MLVTYYNSVLVIVSLAKMTFRGLCTMFHLICPIKVPRLHGRTCTSTWTLSVLVWLPNLLSWNRRWRQMRLICGVGWLENFLGGIRWAFATPTKHMKFAELSWSILEHGYAWSQVRKLVFLTRSERFYPRAFTVRNWNSRWFWDSGSKCALSCPTTKHFCW